MHMFVEIERKALRFGLTNIVYINLYSSTSNDVVIYSLTLWSTMVPHIVMYYGPSHCDVL